MNHYPKQKKGALKQNGHTEGHRSSWDALETKWELADVVRLFSHHSCSNVGGCWWLEKGKYHIHLQEGQDAGYKEWQGSQPNLSPREDCGMNPPGSHVQAHEEQECDGEASMDLPRTNCAWLTRRLLMIRWLVQWMRGEQRILIFLDFCEAFCVASCSILVVKREIWAGQTDCEVGGKLTALSDSKGCEQCQEVQWVACY